ncbi:MAG: Gfo/Idh/MocA family oxidoreductase [Vicinamibacteria bacterium]
MTGAERSVALIGFGLAGSVFHAPLIAATPGLTLTTIVTADPKRAARARNEHPGARVEPDADAVWDRAAEHDLAVVATANQAHAELASRAIDAGLAVVVDKPLAPTAAEARALVEQAARRGTVLTVFHNRRWDSDQLTLRRLLAEDRLGGVHRYESRFERWRPQPRPGAWRETTPPERGGGVLLDLGTHLVDQALVLFGPVTAVHGEVDSRRGGVADDDAFIALTHESGVHSHLWASSVAAAPGPRLRVLGSEAAYVVDVVDGQEDALARGEHPGAGPEWGVEPPERWGRLVRGDESEPAPSEPGGWPRFYVELEAALRGGGPPPVDPADAVTVLELLERARRSPERP